MVRPSNLPKVSDQRLVGVGARLLDLVHPRDGFFSFRLLCISDESESSTPLRISVLHDDLRSEKLT
jgi:hypothetical protein